MSEHDEAYYQRQFADRAARSNPRVNEIVVPDQTKAPGPYVAAIEFIEKLVSSDGRLVVLEVKVNDEGEDRTVGGLSLSTAVWDPFWRALVRATPELDRAGISISRVHSRERFL